MGSLSVALRATVRWRTSHPGTVSVPVDVVYRPAGEDPELLVEELDGAQVGGSPLGVVRFGEDGDQKASCVEDPGPGGQVRVLVGRAHRLDDLDVRHGGTPRRSLRGPA